MSFHSFHAAFGRSRAPAHIIMLQTPQVILLCAVSVSSCFLLSAALFVHATLFAAPFATAALVTLGLVLIKTVLWQTCARLLCAPAPTGVIFVLCGYGVSSAAWSFALSRAPQAVDLPPLFIAAVETTVVASLLFLILAAMHHRKAQDNGRRAELQNHIRNHFLFNAISTATGLLRKQPQTAESQLCRLAELFRAMLGARAWISLKEELELTRNYAEIERVRLGGRFDIVWRISCSRMGDIRLPAMTLHPLVENAIRYGVAEMTQSAVITVSITRHPTHISCRVANAVPRRIPKPGNRTAQANVRRRLYEAFGDQGRFFVEQDADVYISRFTVPIHRTSRA